MRTINDNLAVLAAFSAVAGACRADAPLGTSSPAPTIVSAAVSANPNNVLSSMVSLTTEQADSARIIYLGESLPPDSTPYAGLRGAADTLVTLGLRGSTAYRHVVEVVGPGGRISSDTLAFTTGAVPEALNRIAITTRGEGIGLTLTSIVVPGAGVFAIAFDAAGGIRWYRHFEGTDRFSGELKRQPNGNFTLYRGGSTGVEQVSGHYVEFTSAGDSIRSITVSPPRYLDNHDLWITRGPDGTERFHFFTYDHRTSDLRPAGGGAEVSLAGHQLVRMRPDGSIEFEWNAWDRLTFEEWVELPRPTPDDSVGRDFDHPNSLAFDRDGNYLVSFRNLAQVVKLDAETGAILWRLGGLKSDFTFRDDPFDGFSAQHSAGILPDGNLLLYDNGTSHQPQETRTVEYSLDLAARTATLVWQFRQLPPVYTPAVGSAQRLDDGNTLVGYGWIGRASEVGRDGSVKWAAELSVDGQPALVYRLVRIGSLY